MLADLYENNSYEVLKRTAEDRSAWRDCTRKKVLKPAVWWTTKEESNGKYITNSQHIYIFSVLATLFVIFLSLPHETKPVISQFLNKHSIFSRSTFKILLSFVHAVQVYK